MSHAILAPSSASRWISCTRSARLEQQFPDRAGAAASEGTLAHALAEVLLSDALKLINKTLLVQQLRSIREHKQYEPAMEEYIGQYTTFVLEQYAAAQAHTPDALIYLEEKVDMTEYVPEGFGTVDVQIVADGTLHIIDLKYGKGVSVSAVNNKQMMLYALGVLRKFDMLFDLNTIRMTIHQPRIDNYSTFEISYDDLVKWAADELVPRAKLAFDGEGEFAVGDHCRFCKAKAVCRAHADFNLETAKDVFKDCSLLSDEEVVELLPRLDMLVKWASALEDHALYEAVNNGKSWPGYKLVEGRSNRVFTDAGAVAKVLGGLGYKDEDIYNKKLKGIGDMEKLVSKPVFAAKLGPLVNKPPGKPTLASADDKRPTFHSSDAAKLAFADVSLDDLDI